MIRILVVEDDADLNELQCRFLNDSGYAAFGVRSAGEALDALYSKTYDLIISDIMMPGMDGFQLAKLIRAENKEIPILFLTARDDFMSKEKGYDLGIDDYMVKPVNLNELLLHIKALLRRAKIAQVRRITIGNTVVDEEQTAVTVNGEAVSLTLREFQILYKLLSYPSRTFTRSQLMDDYSGAEKESGLRTVDVHITNLRQKLADSDGFEIVTVRGLGYKARLNKAK